MSASSARALAPGKLLSASLAAAAVLSSGQGHCAEKREAARIELLARAIVPGEAIRIRAHFPEPVARVTGSFLGRELPFLRERPDSAPDSPARDWSAWAVVGLNQRPVHALVDVRGVGAAGREFLATKPVSVRSKKFPTQRLTVDSKYVSPPPAVVERIAEEREEMARVYAMRTELSPPSGVFVRPVPGTATSTFGARRILNGEPRDPHPGLDLKAAVGTPVVASGPGRVVAARDLYYSGGTVVIDHGGGLFTVYAHLSRMDVTEGASVQAGTALGLSGATGRVTGPHLHWGAKIGELPFDPAALLDPRLFR